MKNKIKTNDIQTSEEKIPCAKRRKLYFRILKKLMKCRYKEPKFVYLGEEITGGGLILSNHEGTDAPMSLEIYLDRPLRMWGASEMNSGLIKLYKYQTKVYYHEKKHWNIHLARLFCLIASPLTNLFYSGLDLISTYRDTRLVKTMRESVEAIQNGDNIVVFPEDSSKGYLPQLEGFHEGFVMLADVCRMKGIDLPIFVTYFKKEEGVYIIDKPILYSSLKEKGMSRGEIADYLCERCNALGRLTSDEIAVLSEKREGAAESLKIS